MQPMGAFIEAQPVQQMTQPLTHRPLECARKPGQSRRVDQPAKVHEHRRDMIEPPAARG